MPFCVQCGSKVGDADPFCAKCGAKQHDAGRKGFSSSYTPFDPAAGISDRTASLLCYIPWIGWIAAIVVLASHRFRQNAKIRFHAFQGLYLFVAWLIVEHVVTPVFDWGIDIPMHHLASGALKLVIFAAWVFMMIKVSHDEHYRLPIIGELAERSVSEQRS